MSSSLELLLKHTIKKSKTEEITRENTSSIILGFGDNDSDEELLLHQIQILKKFSNEIIISVPYKWETEIIWKNQDYKIKAVERETGEKSTNILTLEKLQKICINDFILVIPYDLSLSQNKISHLINKDYSLATFLGTNGNLIPNLFFYNRWANRFLTQIAKISDRNNFCDFFRLSSSTIYLRLSKFQSIKFTEIVPKEDPFFEVNSDSLSFPLKIEFDNNIQDKVKMIALLQSLKSEIEKIGKTSSSFRIQQLLILSEKLALRGNAFLALQIHLFFMKNMKKIEKLPLNWDFNEIRNSCRKWLLDESNMYAKNRIERLRLQCLEDILDYNLVKNSDKGWIEKEKEVIISDLKTDNVEFQI